MIKVKEINLHRVEGKVEEITVATFSHANRVLSRMSDTAPRRGYDKVEFKLTFEDGETYEGRYDLQHWSVTMPSLERHIRGHIDFMSGHKCPSNMKPHDYENYIKDCRYNFRRFKEKYWIGN